MSWIPQSLPDNVKIVVSVTEPSAHLNRLRQTLDKSVDSFIRVRTTIQSAQYMLTVIINYMSILCACIDLKHDG